MTGLKLYASLALAALVVGLAGLVAYYRDLYVDTEVDLRVLQGQVEAANTEADTKLRRLTAERDALQETLNKRAQAQEKKDGETRDELERLARAADAVPTGVRVRTAACPARSSGGGAAGGAPAAAVPGAGDADTTAGVLAPAADRSVKRAIEDIETLQAAFNSCKDSTK